MTNRTKGQTDTMIPKTEIVPLLHAALAALVKYQDEIDRLNVYPVPDGDTGTNMVLTMKSVCAEAAKASDASIKELSKAITYGSLMGARGNSGVILSQIIRGICEHIEKREEITTQTMIEALVNGAEVAYKAVKRPVEGTMLTVIKDMARAGVSLSGKDIEPTELLTYLVEEGKRSVERTPELLPILKESGVVDSGGYGLVIMAKGMLSAQKGIRIDNGIADDIGSMTLVDEVIEYGYCTEFVLKSRGIDMSALESMLEHLGDSVLVVGTPELTKIHVHTNDPGQVIQIATGLGSITEVQVNNIIEQSNQRAKALREETAKLEKDGVAVVAVANGEGVSDILLSLGVSSIVSGGQSMNPSTADILEAVNKLPYRDVIILPNNKNIIMAAQQVVDVSEKNVKVVPTRSIPEAFAALLAFSADMAIDENVAAMIAGCEDVKTGEITYAVRDAKNGGFKKDDFIGLYNGDIRAAGEDLLGTTIALLKEMVDDLDEVITIIAGDSVGREDVDELASMVEEEFPDAEIDIQFGSQPVYHFIIGIE